MAHTCRSNLTDDELLRDIENTRQHSPVIEELAQRLEKYAALDHSSTGDAQCPICESKLEITLTDNKYEVEASNVR